MHKIVRVLSLLLSSSSLIGATFATPAFAHVITPPEHVINPVARHVKLDKAHHVSYLSLSQKIVDLAIKYNHAPYVWGGMSPSGFDCSGYTKYVFGQLGIDLPRTASDQASLGTYVSESNLQPGDLVFFSTYGDGITHVGIYIGNGQFISAASVDVCISSIYSEYWSSHYVTARHIS